MPYMGRGGFSSFGSESLGRKLNEQGKIIDSNDDTERRQYRGGIGINYYVPLNNSFFVYQLILIIIAIIVATITYVVVYKSTIIDPIEDLKSTIIKTYFGTCLLLLIESIIINIFSKDKRTLIRRLFIILAISLMTLIVFLGIKISMNSIYTSSKFEQIYEEEHFGENLLQSKKRVAGIDITGAYLKTEKEYYVDECTKLYNNFSIETYWIMGFNILLLFLILFQILRSSYVQEKKDRVSRDDIVLFDEEENIKI